MSTPTTTSGTTCLYGRVQLFQTGLIGALNGTITPPRSSAIRITQVVGPAGGPVSLNQVNGRFATVCGTLQPAQDGCQLNVSVVIPEVGGGAPEAISPCQAQLAALLLQNLFGGL